MLCYVTLEHQAWQIFRRLICFNTLTECYTLFLYIRMLFFRPRLNILIFPPILGLKYSCIINYISVLQVFGIQICSRYIVHVLHCFSLQSARSRCHVKRHLAVLALKKAFRTQNYIYPFQNLSLGFILKISQISASIFL